MNRHLAHRRLAVVQHEDLVPPGAVATWAESHNVDLQVFRPDQDEEFPHPDDADLFVILGGTIDVSDASRLPWLAREIEWLRSLIGDDATLSPQVPPLLGICLGAQLIAHVVGGQVGPLDEPERGWHAVRLTAAGRDHPLLAQVPASFLAFESHGQGFRLPASTPVLATTHGWEGQMFALGTRVLGLQFHPEFTEAIVREISTHPTSWSGPYVHDASTFYAEPGRFSAQHEVLYAVLDALAAQAN